MALNDKQRKAIMVAAVTITVILIWNAPQIEEETSLPSLPQREQKTRVGRETIATLKSTWRDTLQTERLWNEEDELPDPYMVRLPPPPKPPPPPPKEEEEAPPEAPSLPYTYMGEANKDGGSREVFLLRDKKLYIVKEGDILDKEYQVEAIEGNVMKLNYLPLEIKQELAIGGTQ